jgi:hypothetical protein
MGKLEYIFQRRRDGDISHSMDFQNFGALKVYAKLEQESLRSCNEVEGFWTRNTILS